ncbi:unnamed protein product, partial [Symbiodinium sp. CCMP2592]
AEKFENAVRALQEAQKEKVAAIEGANEQAREINREAKELDESRAKKQMRLQLMTESSKITDQSCEDTKKKLDKESAVHQELALKRAKIDKELEELNAHNRHAQQEAQRMFVICRLNESTGGNVLATDQRKKCMLLYLKGIRPRRQVPTVLAVSCCRAAYGLQHCGSRRQRSADNGGP